MYKDIISFSLWGSNLGYCIGALDNAKRAKDIYPGWICRFYIDEFVPQRYVDQLRELGCEIVLKRRGQNNEWLGLYWRFEPMYDDGMVRRFIVRDTDSRVNVREAAAVKEWIDSGLPFHIMRDNPSHVVGIMGGMWGAIAGILPEWKILVDTWLANIKPDPNNPRGLYHGTDQIFLEKIIWPYIEKSHIAHIGCEEVRFTEYDKPFSVKLKNAGYVGMIYSKDDEERTQPCDAA
jgi:hypothetical protein